MVDIAPILEKVRALGSDIVIEKGAMTIKNGALLTNEQRVWISKNRSAIETYLEPAVAGSVPPPTSDDTQPMTWGQFARILYAEPPETMDPMDWSYFVTQSSKVVRRYLGVVE